MTSSPSADSKSSGTVVTPPPRFSRLSAFLTFDGEAVDAQPQVGAKPRAFRVVAAEHVLLERVGEELLRQVGGRVGIELPLEAKVLVEGFQYASIRIAKRQTDASLIVAARARHDREPRRREVHEQLHYSRAT